MPSPRHLLFAAVYCSLAFAGNAQSSTWKTLQFGKLSLKYPPTWHLNKESKGGQTRVTLTPDSMQQLTMRMIEIYELPLTSEHTYDLFKKNFPTMVRSRARDETTIGNIQEISFKGHKTMYGEIIEPDLPARIYGINAGTAVYPILLFSRRYIKIPDPKLERDETAILNSITLGQ